MNRTRSLSLSLSLLLCGSAAAETRQDGGGLPPASQKPNIVLILADDLGVQCLRAYGGTSLKTPNIDKLAGKWHVSYEHKHNTIREFGFDHYQTWSIFDERGEKTTRYWNPSLIRDDRPIAGEVKDRYGPDVDLKVYMLSNKDELRRIVEPWEDPATPNENKHPEQEDAARKALQSVFDSLGK